jgi:LPS export ABC transporter permease LptG
MISNFLFELSDWLIVDNIDFNVIFRVLIYRLPSIIVETFPLAILFSSIIALSNLNENNEIVAITMGGVNMTRLLIPLIIIGLFLSGGSFLLNEVVVPKTNHLSNQLIRENIIKAQMPDVEEGVFFKDDEGRIFFVDSYNKRNMILNNVMIYNNNNKKDFPPLITANRGLIKENKWLLQDGYVHTFNERGKLSLNTSFKNMEVNLFNDIDKFFSEQKSSQEMTRKELKERLDLFSRSGINIKSLLVDYHMKISTVFTSLIFIVLGFSLSVGFKNNKIFNIVSIILLIFIYYLISSLSRSFGVKGTIPPLLAAWLPQIFYTILTIIFYFFKDNLFNLFKTKVIVKFLMFVSIFIIFSNSPLVLAETIEIESNNSQYNSFNNEYQLNNDVFINYNNKINLKTDEIIIKGKENNKILSEIKEIKIKKNIFSGCSNPEHFHYYFKAQKTIIYPDDYLIAYNVVLWELGGKIPIFYYPVLYIPLKDSNVNFHYGYDQRRGYYIGFNYDYIFNNLPGTTYLTYYNQSGFQGGFKQHLIYNQKNRLYIKYLTQEDKIDLGLYNNYVESKYSYENNNFNLNMIDKYYDYDFYYTNQFKSIINYKNNRNIISLNSDIYNRENKIYNELYERSSNRIRLNYYLNNNLNYYLNVKENSITSNNNIKKRLSWNSYLKYKTNKLTAVLEVEEYQPNYYNEYQKRTLAFSKKPELKINYNLNKNIDYNYINGYYIEKEVEGKKNTNQLVYNYKYILNDYINFRIIQSLEMSSYKIYQHKKNWLIGYQDKYYTYKPEYKLNIKYNNFYWNNNYRLVYRKGYTPFDFDTEDYSEAIDLDFGYDDNKFEFNIRSRYDFDIQNFKFVNLNSNYKTDNFEIDLNTGYDFKNERFYDLTLNTKGVLTKNLNFNNGLRYDLNNNEFKNIESKIIYEKKNNIFIDYKIDYDLVNEELIKNKISITKDLHCRELSFSYDFKEEKYFIEYSMDLFSGFSFSN